MPRPTHPDLLCRERPLGAGLWIKNISNIAVIAASAAAGIPGPSTAYLEEPRTFGARVAANYASERV
jgi:hypothetical protein